MEYGIVVIGQCFVDGEPFTFDPDRVIAIPIDLEIGLPPDLGGSAHRAVFVPVCARHIQVANERRSQIGMPPVHVFADSTTQWE